MYFDNDYLIAVLNTNLLMYYDSIVYIHVVFTGQIQGDYIGAMAVFFYMWTICLLIDHLPVSGLLKFVLLCSVVSVFTFHLRVLCCVDLASIYAVYWFCVSLKIDHCAVKLARSWFRIEIILQRSLNKARGNRGDSADGRISMVRVH